MVVVAQLARASDCGSECRRFETDLPPQRMSKDILFFIPQISDEKKYSNPYLCK